MKNLAVICLLLLNLNSFFSQSENLSQFDDKLIHFGFALSTNNSGFDLERNFPGSDSLRSVLVSGKTSFSLGVVTSINVNPNFKIRFILPTLSFLERAIDYTFVDPATNLETVYKKPLNSTYLDFPLLFKFRTNRIHNFAVYGITGFKYGIDMSSNIDVNNNGVGEEEKVVKLEKTDFSSEVGGGVDLFLKYFKLGIEIKLASGMRNLLYMTPDKARNLGEEPSKFENAIKSLKSRVWTLSFTFEG
ncbi:MAG: hypothetical protein CL827_02900 [Crocinitomicaceae bacterium]|nr:hypothetical protein [Crocinitomicaceae bacterium]|tara:strand:+ start:814 stop:1551 length:738 start_codon:yes stop_codon:yes gene_type:complete